MTTKIMQVLLAGSSMLLFLGSLCIILDPQSIADVQRAPLMGATAIGGMFASVLMGMK